MSGSTFFKPPALPEVADSPGDTKEDHGIKKNPNNTYAAKAASAQKKKALDDPTPMALEQFIGWCKKSPHRHVHLIGEYADEKKIHHSTVGQWQSFIQRNLRPARLLSPYTDQQIATAMTQLNTARKDYLKKWTLETLLKYLEDK